MKEFDQNLSPDIGGKESLEAKQNLLGFFDLLLKIDKRNNPDKYKKPLDLLNNNL